MKAFFDSVTNNFTVMREGIDFYLGGADQLLVILLMLVVADYITGVMCAINERKLSSDIGFKGIFRKVLIFILVGIANELDMGIVGEGRMIRSTVLFFYISNEGISLLENATHLGLPVPEKLKQILKQLQDKEVQ